MQQENHLKEMEDDMQSFVSSKDEVIQSPIIFFTSQFILYEWSSRGVYW